MSNGADLVYVLSDLLHGQLASIEILPGGLQEWADIEMPPNTQKPSPEFPFVLVEGNLGIPKKILYVLYTAAVHMPWQSSDSRVATAASAVIVLLNPAHQTALNTRKRLVRDGHLAAEKELQLTELISRGSPECGKQSMIWDHRRWCFQQIYGIMGIARETPRLEQWASSEEMRMFPKMNPAAISHELNIVYHTCETYPRNYYAWSHWHFAVNVCYASIHLSDDYATKRDFFGVIAHEYSRLQEWVDRHVSDYSAVHQLCQTQNLMRYLESTRFYEAEAETRLARKPLANHAYTLVAAYPSHESLWLYLRVSLAELSLQKRSIILERLKIEFPSSDNRYAERLLAWYSR